VAIPRAELDHLVARAIAKASDEGITGKSLTPYLLKALDELSEGRTTTVNRALALSNAGLGARLAAALTRA
jgi:pseudouridine-5'-phosphate glycosidase